MLRLRPVPPALALVALASSCVQTRERSPLHVTVDPSEFDLSPTLESVPLRTSSRAPASGPPRSIQTDVDFEPESSEGEWSGLFALGPGLAPSFEGSDELDPIPFSVIRLSKGGVGYEAEGLGGRFDLVANEERAPRFEYGPAYDLRLPREDTGELIIDGLEEVGFALELGAFVRTVLPLDLAPNDELEARLTVNGDVTGTHDGVVATFESDYSAFPRQNVRLSFGLRASYASENFMQTYFGVDEASAANVGIQPFDAGAGMRSAGAQASMLFLFSPNHGVFGLVRYDRLLGDAADSSLVEAAGSADQLLVGLAYTYRF